MHNLHFFRNFVWNMSRIFPCLLESFMSRICPVLFVRNLSRIFSCPEYVQFYLSRICPEFFHVQNMSGKNFWNFSCPEFVQFICPDFVHVQKTRQILDMKKNFPDIFQTCKKSGQQLWSFFRTFSGHFPDMKNKFRTNSGQFRWHFPDISFL